jgi:hypothetical protein
MKMLKEQKVIVQNESIEEVSNEGLEALLGQTVTIFCMSYIYAGKLIGVNKTCIKLEDAHIVYETGAFSDKTFKDAQKLGSEFYVQMSAIESFGFLKNL